MPETEGIKAEDCKTTILKFFFPLSKYLTLNCIPFVKLYTYLYTISKTWVAEKPRVRLRTLPWMITEPPPLPPCHYHKLSRITNKSIKFKVAQSFTDRSKNSLLHRPSGIIIKLRTDISRRGQGESTQEGWRGRREGRQSRESTEKSGSGDRKRIPG